MPTEQLPGVWCYQRRDEPLPLDLLFGALDASEAERLDQHLRRLHRELRQLADDLSARLAPRTCPVRDLTLTHFVAWGDVQLSLSLGGGNWPGGVDLSVSNWYEDDTDRHPAPPYEIGGGVAIHCSTRPCPHLGVHDLWTATVHADTPADVLTELATLLDRARRELAQLSDDQLAGHLNHDAPRR